MSKKTTSKNFYFRVLKEIEDTSLVVAAKKFNMSKQNFNYYVNPLKKQQVLNKVGYGVWSINWKNFEKFKPKQVKKIKLGDITTSPKEVKKTRGHAFVFRLELPKIKNWHKRRLNFENKELKYQNLKYGEKWVIKDCKVHTYSKAVIVYFPKDKSYLSKWARENKSYAIADFLDIIYALENLLNVSFRQNGKYIYKIMRQHQADMNNILAKQYSKNKKQLFIRNIEGTLKYIIDDSGNMEEMEAVDGDKADEDMDHVIKPFFQQIDRMRTLPEDWVYMIKTNTSHIGNLIEDRKHYAENIKSHITAIQTMARVLEDLKSEVKKLSKRKH